MTKHIEAAAKAVWKAEAAAIEAASAAGDMLRPCLAALHEQPISLERKGELLAELHEALTVSLAALEALYHLHDIAGQAVKDTGEPLPRPLSGAGGNKEP